VKFVRSTAGAMSIWSWARSPLTTVAAPHKTTPNGTRLTVAMTDRLLVALKSVDIIRTTSSGARLTARR
jgi:hypothetical protein